jgi:hypothetical protein
MEAISFYFPSLPACPSFHIPKKTFEKINSVAASALAELTAALALNLTINAAFGVFMLPHSAHFMTAVCGLAAVGLGALLVVKIWQTCFPSQEVCQKTTLNFSVQMEGISRSLARLSIINTATLKLSHYIHEFGHAGAALLCYLQADPAIVVKWYEGMTTYNISYGLTKFGEFLGEHQAMLFVTSAGLFTPVIFALGEFTAAHLIHDNHPLASEMLNCHGVSQILNLALYGFQALDASLSILKHDFIRLWVMGGIHPLIPLTLIVALPLCTWMAFKYRELGTNQQIAQA